MTRFFAAVLAMSLVTAPYLADAASTDVTFKTADGVTIYGAYADVPSPKATIVLFHQAGSSHQEYDAIAPRLNAAGYSTLAIDQRSGGSLFGENKTARAFGKNAQYPDALPDLEAALAWAHMHNAHPVIVWGSSYSASLVFVLAAKHPHDIKAVLAFSPGEYFDGTPSVSTAAAHVNVPIFVDSAANTTEITSARTILSASPSKVKVQYVPTAGVHGSSTLLTNKDPQGAAANWAAVLAFLKTIQ